MLLVISDPSDNHLPFLLPRLEDRGVDHVCLDTADFPSRVALELGVDARGTVRGTVRGRDRSWKVSDVTAVWNRRAASPRASSAITEPTHRAYAELQSRALLDGLWWMLDCRWLPARPMLDHRASNKLVNLTRAARLGFAIPQTVMTNDPDAFLELHEHQLGRMVSKAFAYSSQLACDDEPAPYEVCAHPVRRRDLATLHAIRDAPATFQRHVARRVELRVIVVGDRVFAAELARPALDVQRLDDDAMGYAVHALPAEIAERCARLVRSLDLSYGALDLLLTDDGAYVFRGLDANGEWAELERQTGLPIGEAIVDWLVGAASAAA